MAYSIYSILFCIFFTNIGFQSPFLATALMTIIKLRFDQHINFLFLFWFLLFVWHQKVACYVTMQQYFGCGHNTKIQLNYSPQ